MNNEPRTMNNELKTMNKLPNLPTYALVPCILGLESCILCLESSTFVKNPLQITPLLCKTKPILSAVGGLQMNVNSILTKDYERNDIFTVSENKPKTNPIKPNTKPIKANTMPKQSQSNPKQTQNKLEANLSLRERRSLRVSFSESSNRGPISNSKRIYP